MCSASPTRLATIKSTSRLARRQTSSLGTSSHNAAGISVRQRRSVPSFSELAADSSLIAGRFTPRSTQRWPSNIELLPRTTSHQYPANAPRRANTCPSHPRPGRPDNNSASRWSTSRGPAQWLRPRRILPGANSTNGMLAGSVWANSQCGPTTLPVNRASAAQHHSECARKLALRLATPRRRTPMHDRNWICP